MHDAQGPLRRDPSVPTLAAQVLAVSLVVHARPSADSGATSCGWVARDCGCFDGAVAQPFSAAGRR
jgi:hypothetical protein